MSDDVKAAAERVLEAFDIADWQGSTQKHSDMRAAIVVARAYLAIAARPVGDVVRGIVREAVEAGIQFESDSLFARPYPTEEAQKKAMGEVVEKLAARLAPFLRDTRADDGEAVDEAFLRSMGFHEVDLSWQDDQFTKNRPAFTIGGAQDVGHDYFGVWAVDGKWAAYWLNADGFDGQETWLTLVPTRGHVRRLAAALGVPLKDAARANAREA